MGNAEPPSFPENRSDLYLEKPLPSSPESERLVLGAIILDSSALSDAEVLLPEDFYSPQNKSIFSAMLSLADKGKQINPILIGEEIRSEGMLETVGGVSSITNLTFGLPPFSSIEEYVKVVKDKSRARGLIRKLSQLTTRALSEEEDLGDLMDAVEESILETTRSDEAGGGFKQAHEVADRVIETAQRIAHGEMDALGLLTGFTDLDAMTLGLQPADLIIVGGRPSMGKTTLGIDIGRHVAYALMKTAAVFSLEMSEEQLAARILCSEGDIKGQRLRAGTLNPDEWARLTTARERMATGRLMIDDTPALTTATLRRKARRLRRQLEAEGRSLDIVIVDYLQLMDGEGKENRQQDVTAISRGLKRLAKELHCPVVALSQLSRQPEGRTANKHRPMLSDLRESGAIEQDADVVAFVYREEMYPNSDGTVSGVGEGEVIVAKQRNGPTGTVTLTFIKESTKFVNHIAEF